MPNQILFELDSCAVRNFEVVCAVSVTSDYRDRSLVVGAYRGSASSIFNQNNNQYLQTRVTIGGESSANQVLTRAPADKPIRVEITFGATDVVTTSQSSGFTRKIRVVSLFELRPS